MWIDTPKLAQLKLTRLQGAGWFNLDYLVGRSSLPRRIAPAGRRAQPTPPGTAPRPSRSRQVAHSQRQNWHFNNLIRQDHLESVGAGRQAVDPELATVVQLCPPLTGVGGQA